jgi:hypothetical protein
MRNGRGLLLSLGVLTMAFGGAACDRKPAPVAELQTVTPEQPRMQPVTVVGCLKRGTLTDQTFVLLERSADGSTTGQTSTYQLVAGPNEALEDHVGKTVEIAGTLESQQQIASRAGGTVEDKAEGTSGTPRVDTTTAIDVKTLRVERVKGMGSACE